MKHILHLSEIENIAAVINKFLLDHKLNFDCVYNKFFTSNHDLNISILYEERFTWEIDDKIRIYLNKSIGNKIFEYDFYYKTDIVPKKYNSINFQDIKPEILIDFLNDMMGKFYE